MHVLDYLQVVPTPRLLEMGLLCLDVGLDPGSISTSKKRLC